MPNIGIYVEGSAFCDYICFKMKRIGNLFERIVNIDNLRLAAQNASSKKKHYSEVVEFFKDPEPLLLKLRESLLNGTYRTSRYVEFERMEGSKVRRIYKLPFYPDRIVHWAILQIIEPVFLKSFIQTTYSAIPGRGTHKALDKVKKDIIQNPQNKYFVKLDIRKYYASINHDILKRLLARKFKDKRLLNILYEIIDSLPPDKGVPIGNYLSQYFGNFYLSYLDHYIKHTLRIKQYYRYMDDLVVVSDTPRRIRQITKRIILFIEKVLRLFVKNIWRVQSLAGGLDFVGFRIFHNGVILIRKSIKDRILERIRIIHKYKERISRHLYMSFNSFMGWIKYSFAEGFIEKYIKPLRGYLEYSNLINFHRGFMDSLVLENNGDILIGDLEIYKKVAFRFSEAVSLLRDKLYITYSLVRL